MHVWRQLRLRNRGETDTADELERMESPADGPAEILSRKEMLSAVERGLSRLSAEHREIIVLCELEEMKYEDVATILAVPVGTVRSRLYRAKRNLALLLKASYE